MTVYDNIAFPLRLRRWRKEEIDRRVREMAQHGANRGAAGSASRRSCRAASSSGWRCAGRWCKEPDLLLLDEPLSNLDARLRIETRTEIKRLQAELGITTVLVTHDQIEAMTMAERVAVMRKGKIEQLSTPAELYRRPENLFVASFIGDPPMNLLRTRQSVDDGRPSLNGGDGFVLSLPAAFQKSLERRHGPRRGAGHPAGAREDRERSRARPRFGGKCL